MPKDRRGQPAPGTIEPFRPDSLDAAARLTFTAHMQRNATLILTVLLASTVLARQGPPGDSRQALARIRARVAGHENEMAEAVFSNISILKGRPAGRLPGMMEALTGLIGVECSYCHVEGNWASDDKPAKRTARAHFAMIRQLNDEQFGGQNKVSCWTCHHGRPQPELTGRPDAFAAPTLAFVALIVPHADETARWYEEKLGFRETKRSSAPSGIARNVTVESPLGMIEIIEHDQSVPMESVVTDPARRRLVRGISKAGFFVTGIEKLETDLRAKGADFVSRLFTDDELGLKSFIVRDNAGNYIQFMERIAR